MVSTWILFALAAVAAAQDCQDYVSYTGQAHAPFSSGKYNFSSMRPPEECRSFSSSEVEGVITDMQQKIADPDLYQLFQNAWPNTLDTTVRWVGNSSDDTSEELSFIITGDIDAMWLRDSANQLKSYLPVLSANNTIGSLYRGAINLQARYLNESFFCQAFQPPAESQISATANGAVDNDNVTPSYNNNTVFECKWELDSVASFLDLSASYYRVTNDSSFFSNYQWTQTVQSILNQSYYLQNSTYSADGSVTTTPYTFTRLSSDSEGTQDNSGSGNAFENTGLIRSWFRPSDDATIYQGFIPANMMFSSALSSSVSIANAIGESDLADQMSTLAKTVSKAIQKWGVKKVTTVDGQTTSVYAFEVDGYGSQNIMDDANLPSLLGAPVYGYVGTNDTTFQATRKLLLSSKNPYYGNGSVIAGIGSPHTGFGRVWPMSLIVRIMTSDDDEEIISTLELLLGSTGGTGLIHESVNVNDGGDFSRQWFAWANGLFGQMILELYQRKPHILQHSFQ
ncbi:uncharacterized protein TRUGW13939_11152 [Talaromyces rugulosus]|uniref:Glycoside hydrolase family 125 protein n=1 Tax=Talaromyces rugulosus TaxID=121627 RepID=A0A7H8RBZ3_TALRU|nr:uncharacterized protein TRUGW13939_11152 [Talaromyces rugulosus]QKX63979.1 hypothetical protein TRUGW13939_11152 [Talaromyces rugulosus]